MHSLFLFKLCPLRSRIVQQLNLFSPENKIHQRVVIKNLKKKNREKNTKSWTIWNKKFTKKNIYATRNLVIYQITKQEGYIYVKLTVTYTTDFFYSQATL